MSRHAKPASVSRAPGRGVSGGGVAASSGLTGSGFLAPASLPRLLRPPHIARHLGVSVRWVYRLLQEPDERGLSRGGYQRCGGLPALPSFEHPAGGRCVRADVYLAYLAEWMPDAVPDHAEGSAA